MRGTAVVACVLMSCCGCVRFLSGTILTNCTRDGVISDMNCSEQLIPVPLSHSDTAVPTCLY